MIEGELEFLKLLQGIRTDFLNQFFEAITIFGEETPMILIIAVLYYAIDKVFAQKLFFITLTSMGINGIIKNIIRLPRPFASGEINCVRPDTATGYSFPSGHTQNFSTWTTVFNLKIKKIGLAILTAILIALVAFSRNYLGAHYPSDVITGAILGVLFAIIGCRIYDKSENKNRLYAFTILALTPFALFFLINAEPLFADFYKFYGMLVGFFFAVLFEEKYAQMEYNVPIWKKVIRIVIGIVFAYLIKESTKILDVLVVAQISLLIDMVSHILLAFVAFGICPMIFKKFKL